MLSSKHSTPKGSAAAVVVRLKNCMLSCEKAVVLSAMEFTQLQLDVLEGRLDRNRGIFLPL